MCCDVAADATARVGVEELPELRRRPGLVCGEPLPASFLKHADEQTVVGLMAVFQAIDRAGLQATCFRDWGVLAAPRFLGRPAMAAALQRFQAEGAWGVSPHLIPHRSLHSISGTVSQALKIHGPNFGVGGGPGAAAEVLLAATAMLEREDLPGVWVVLTCLHPDIAPEASGRPAPGSLLIGMALALTPVQPSGSRIRLRFVRGTSAQPASARTQVADGAGEGFDLLRLEALLSVLHASDGDTHIVQLLDSCSRIELCRPGSSLSDRPPRAATPYRAPSEGVRGAVSSDADRGRFVLVDY